MGVPFPIINGVMHSYASIEAILGPAGRVSVAMSSINYSRKRDRDMPRGAHPDPIGKTRGDNKYDGDCELYLVQWQLLQVSMGLEGYGDIPFPIFVTYSDIGMPTIVDTLLGCTIDSTEVSQSQSNKALSRKIDLSPVKIYFNGVDDNIIPLVASDF
jgi:hypothetical protein